MPGAGPARHAAAARPPLEPAHAAASVHAALVSDEEDVVSEGAGDLSSMRRGVDRLYDSQRSMILLR